MKTNPAGIELIKRWEGCRLEAYLCPAGIPTIGYGHTEGVKLGHKITQHQADVLLEHDLEVFEEGIDRLFTGITLSENQHAALVALSFNIGLANLANSTLRRKLLAGDVHGAAHEFKRWTLANGVRLAGLISRRAEECALFITP